MRGLAAGSHLASWNEDQKVFSCGWLGKASPKAEILLVSSHQFSAVLETIFPHTLVAHGSYLSLVASCSAANTFLQLGPDWDSMRAVQSSSLEWKGARLVADHYSSLRSGWKVLSSSV